MIVLVGFMGAGKSTVGRALATTLSLPFVDSDQAIEQAEHRTVQEIFDADGEPAFRRLERATVSRLLAGPDSVLSLGGGATEDPHTRRALTGVPVVFLEVGLTEALRRTGRDDSRPMLRRPDLPAVFERRQATYREVATVTVETGETTVTGGAVETGARPVEAIVTQILAELLALLEAPDEDPHPSRA